MSQYAPNFEIPFEIPEEVKTLLEKVVAVFGKYEAVLLSTWTHKPGSPWDIVVNQIDGEGGRLNNFIPDDLIATYFRENVIAKDSNA